MDYNQGTNECTNSSISSSSSLGHLDQVIKQTALILPLIDIKFPNLTYLSLSGCGIASIEQFHRIHIPLLTNLYLSTYLFEWDENKIGRVGPLGKSSFKLGTINISSNVRYQGANPIADVDCLWLASVDFQWLSLEYCTTPLQNNNVRWVAKLPTGKLNDLYLQTPERIVQPQLHQALQRRWKVSIHKW